MTGLRDMGGSYVGLEATPVDCTSGAAVLEEAATMPVSSLACEFDPGFFDGLKENHLKRGIWLTGGCSPDAFVVLLTATGCDGGLRDASEDGSGKVELSCCSSLISGLISWIVEVEGSDGGGDSASFMGDENIVSASWLTFEPFS